MSSQSNVYFVFLKRLKKDVKNQRPQSFLISLRYHALWIAIRLKFGNGGFNRDILERHERYLDINFNP